MKLRSSKNFSKKNTNTIKNKAFESFINKNINMLERVIKKLRTLKNFEI